MQHYETMIADAFYDALDQHTWTGLRSVLLGDISGTVIAANALFPRSINWHNLPGQSREEGLAILTGTTDILYQENSAYASNPTEIQIGYPPGRSSKNSPYYVYGIVSMAGLQAQGNVSQIEQYMLRLGNLWIYNIQDLLVRPTDTTSAAVYVQSGTYELLSTPGIKQKWTGGTLSLANQIDGLASGQHQLAMIYFSHKTGQPGAITCQPIATASALPASGELGDATIATIPRLTTGLEAIGVVYLYNGQVSLVQSDVFTTSDPRFSSAGQTPSNVMHRNDIVVLNNEMVYL